MTSRTDTKKLEAVYRSVGLKKGDVVFLHAKLLPFGKVAESADGFAQHFLDPLKAVIDYPRGTIVAITYTTSYSSYGVPYVHETSPSEAGVLTEYIRTHTGAVRSLHPMGSVSAIGSKKHIICDNVSRSLFGWNSVYHRMHTLGAKGLYLGMRLRETCSFLHYVEHLYGVTHCYHKAYFTPVYRHGKKMIGPYLAFVRNRQAPSFDYTRFERHMRKKNMVQEVRYRGAPIQTVRFEDCFNEGMSVLQKDPCFFLPKEFYVSE